MLDRFGGLGLDRGQRVLGEPALRDPVALETEDRILLLPVGVGERSSVLARVTLVVAAEAVRQALEQERAAAGARRRQIAAERVPHRHDVVAVHGVALHVVRRHHVAHPFDDRVRRTRSELREAVVLAHEDERQPPERSQVHGLVEMAGLHGAVAEEDDRDRVLTPQARSQCTSEGDRDIAADDAGRAHEAAGSVDEVHRSAEPSAQPTVTSHQLGHDAIQRRTLRDRVPVRAVARVHGIGVAQLRADRRGDTFLSHAEVDQAVDLACAREHADAFLEQPDPPHRREQALRLLAAERRPGHYAVTGAVPSTCWTAATILSSFGITHASRGSL